MKESRTRKEGFTVGDFLKLTMVLTLVMTLVMLALPVALEQSFSSSTEGIIRTSFSLPREGGERR
jgi:hypothetical protein